MPSVVLSRAAFRVPSDVHPRPVSIPALPLLACRIIRSMERWFIYDVLWMHGASPLAKNLAVANRRLRRADHEVPLLTEDGFVESREWTGTHVEVFPRRWRNPILTAEDVHRILLESNANPGRVRRRECRCESWTACDAGMTECVWRRPHRSEDERRIECVWIDENYEKFYASRETDGPNRFRNIPRFVR